MLNEVGSDRVRLFRDDDKTLQRFAARNGQTIGKVETKADVAKAMVQALPADAVFDMLQAMEQRLAEQTKPAK